MTKFPYKRIISYGCSITAGDELGDARVLGMTDGQLAEFVRTKRITSSSHLYGELKVTDEMRMRIRDVNGELSWPNYITKHFKVPILNRSISGSSLSSATNEILKDLHNSVINDDDLILVGITGPGRWFQYNEDGKTGGGVVGWGWHDTPQDYQTQLETNYFNKYNLFYTHFKEIAFISNLSDRLNGRIQLCYCHYGPWYLEHIFYKELKKEKFAKFYDFCYNICPPHNFLDTRQALAEMVEITAKRHPFGHPTVKYHKDFADILIKKLEKKYAINNE